MSDLKPCPFCGDDAEWVDIHDDEYGNTGGSVIECVSCGASTHVEFGFKENLTSAWNRRAASRELVPAMADRIEELEAKLAKAVEALVQISDRPNKMIWGEDSEVRVAMRDMEDIADFVLTELTARKSGE